MSFPYVITLYANTKYEQQANDNEAEWATKQIVEATVEVPEAATATFEPEI